MSLQDVQILLFVAVIVSMVCRRLKLPYTVGLTVAGICLTFLPRAPEFVLTKALIFSAFLPPLIFEAAYQLKWNALSKELAVIGALALFGLLVSAAVVVFGLTQVLGWQTPPALALAVLISATDPVSVVATMKDLGLTGRVRLLVEAESLFNDGTAAVLFAIALTVLGGASVTPVAAVADFFRIVSGGIVSGAAIGGLTLMLAGRAEDHLVEVTLTSLAAYASFVLAERLHFSGVLATLTAGIILGNFGPLGAISERGREALESFWEYIAFVANSLLFLLIGLRLTQHAFGSLWPALVVVVGLSLIGRAAGVYLTCLCFWRSRYRVEARHQHVLVWGGLRGALALALALSLPDGTAHRQDILAITFGVVAFSVIGQGLTMPPLLRRLQLLPCPTT